MKTRWKGASFALGLLAALAIAGIGCTGEETGGPSGGEAQDEPQGPGPQEAAQADERAHADDAAQADETAHAEPAHADDAARAEAERWEDASLELRHERRPIRDALDNKPGSEATRGDEMAWFHDHPMVPFVVRGNITEAHAYEDPRTGVVMTRCTMEVAERFKGDAPDTLVFEAFGGNTDGFNAIKTHSPMCAAGEEAIAFLGQDGERLIAVGADWTYAVTRTHEGNDQRWGRKVATFLRALPEMGGAR